MFRTIPFIRHRIRPQRNTKSILRFAVILVTKQKSPSDRFLFLALPSHVGERFPALDHAFANANDGPCTFIAGVRCGLHLARPAGLLLDLLRQSLVLRGDFLHRLPSPCVMHCLGLGKDFLGARSPAADEQ